MPLTQAEMGRVLAIEPEASQADALRQFVRDELGAELVLVSSAYAAVVAINRQTPDVVLFSESVTEKHRDRVLDHLRSTIKPAVPQRLTLPSLRHCDRTALANQLNALVARAQEARPRSATAPSTPPPAAKPPAAPPPAPKSSAPPPAPASQPRTIPAADENFPVPALDLSSTLASKNATSASKDATSVFRDATSASKGAPELDLLTDDLQVVEPMSIDTGDDALEE